MQCLELKILSKAKTGPNCCYARPHPAPSPPPNFHPYPPPYLPCHYPIPQPLSHRPLYLREATDRWNVLVPREMPCIVYRRALYARLPYIFANRRDVPYIAHISHTVDLLTNVLFSVLGTLCALTQEYIPGTLGSPLC